MVVTTLASVSRSSTVHHPDEDGDLPLKLLCYLDYHHLRLIHNETEKTGNGEQMLGWSPDWFNERLPTVAWWRTCVSQVS